MIDSVHALDLGVASNIIGNILYESIANRLWGGPNQDANASLLEADLRGWERRTRAGTRLQGKLTVQRLKSESGFPKLKAKGAQVRHLAEYALTIARKFDSGSQHDRMKVAIAQLLCRVYQCMSSSSQFFPAPALTEFQTAGQKMLLILSALHTAAVESGERRWKFPPKGHLIDHMVSIQAREWGNPSYFWCYGDEDLVGQCIEIARSCHPKTCVASALVKWLVLSFERDE